MPDLNQGTFNFDADGDTSGYANWQAKLDALKRNIEHQHGIILGKPVRVTIKGIDRPAEGILTLAPKQPANTMEPLLHLSSLARLTFLPCEIESITRM